MNPQPHSSGQVLQLELLALALGLVLVYASWRRYEAETRLALEAHARRAARAENDLDGALAKIHEQKQKLEGNGGT